MFPYKFMNFSEAATAGVLWKKLFLKNLQYSQESSRPETLLKTSEYWEIFKNTYFEEHLTAASDFLKQLSYRTATSSSVPLYWLFLSSDNLLTGYEQLSY